MSPVTPTTTGIPFSLAQLEAAARLPPFSVTNALSLPMIGINFGDAASYTRMAPSGNLANSSRLDATMHGPATTPDDAAYPFSLRDLVRCGDGDDSGEVSSTIMLRVASVLAMLSISFLLYRSVILITR
jgi:hypothetical protein